MVSDDDEIRSEIHLLLAWVESLAQRMGQVHARIPIPRQDDLMLLGEAESDFLHKARIVLECALGDRLELLRRDLKTLLAEGRS